jgi:hypothetical protein
MMPEGDRSIATDKYNLEIQSTVFYKKPDAAGEGDVTGYGRDETGETHGCPRDVTRSQRDL